MTNNRPIFLGILAATLICATSAWAQERAIIHVIVDEDGRTVVECEGAECETVDCSGNGQLMAANNTYVIQENESGSCASGQASGQDADFLDFAQQEITDLLLAGPLPGGGGGDLGQGIDSGFVESGESNQRQVEDLDEGSEESAIEL